MSNGRFCIQQCMVYSELGIFASLIQTLTSEVGDSSPECSTKVKYKIDHNSKTKNRTKKTHELKNLFQNVTHLMRQQFYFHSWSAKNT